MNKQDDLNYIKSFCKISLLGICKKLNVNYANLYLGRSSAAKTNLIRKELENEIRELENKK